MSEIWFTATEKFNPSLGRKWIEFYNWAKIPQLKEIISLDSSYRPKELLNLIESDWDYNIHQDYLIAFFRNLEYVLKRFSGRKDSVNILAVSLEPDFDVRETFNDNRFIFQGYDLVGKGNVSAITNCGGFLTKLSKRKIFQMLVYLIHLLLQKKHKNGC